MNQNNNELHTLFLELERLQAELAALIEEEKNVTEHTNVVKQDKTNLYDFRDKLQAWQSCSWSAERTFNTFQDMSNLLEEKERDKNEKIEILNKCFQNTSQGAKWNIFAPSHIVDKIFSDQNEELNSLRESWQHATHLSMTYKKKIN